MVVGEPGFFLSISSVAACPTTRWLTDQLLCAYVWDCGMFKNTFSSYKMRLNVYRAVLEKKKSNYNYEIQQYSGTCNSYVRIPRVTNGFVEDTCGARALRRIVVVAHVGAVAIIARISPRDEDNDFLSISLDGRTHVYMYMCTLSKISWHAFILEILRQRITTILR